MEDGWRWKVLFAMWLLLGGCQCLSVIATFCVWKKTTVKVIFIQKKWASSSFISPTFPALPRNFFFFFLSFSFSFSFSWQALKSLNPQVPRGAIWCLRSRPPIPPIDSDMPFWSDIHENLEIRPINWFFPSTNCAEGFHLRDAFWREFKGEPRCARKPDDWSLRISLGEIGR